MMIEIKKQEAIEKEMKKLGYTSLFSFLQETKKDMATIIRFAKRSGYYKESWMGNPTDILNLEDLLKAIKMDEEEFLAMMEGALNAEELGQMLFDHMAHPLKETIYRGMSLMYTCQDAYNQAQDNLPFDKLEPREVEYLAEKFLENHDCNISDNDQWMLLLCDYAKERKSKFYFTFGSDKRYPFQNTYLVVQAFTKTGAICKFREKYPDRDSEAHIYNAAFCYSQEEWDKLECEKYYPHEPADMIE